MKAWHVTGISRVRAGNRQWAALERSGHAVATAWPQLGRRRSSTGKRIGARCDRPSLGL